MKQFETKGIVCVHCGELKSQHREGAGELTGALYCRESSQPLDLQPKPKAGDGQKTDLVISEVMIEMMGLIVGWSNREAIKLALDELGQEISLRLQERLKAAGAPGVAVIGRVKASELRADEEQLEAMGLKVTKPEIKTEYEWPDVIEVPDDERSTG